MLGHLNRALRDISVRARTLREILSRRVNEDQHAYGLPRTFLDVIRCAWFQGDQWYPLQRRRLGVTQVINHSDVFRTWRPYYYDIWGNSRPERVIATVTSVGPFMNFPSSVMDDVFRFDAGTEFIGDVLTGDTVVNVTDGSAGTITEVSTDGDLFAYSALEGGERTGDEKGSIKVDDELRIVAAAADSQTLHIAPPPPEDSPTGEERLWVYISRRHYEVTEAHVNNVNDTLEIDIELEQATLERLLYWARRQELGATDPEVQAQMVLYETAYHKALPFVRQRIRELDSTWGSPVAFTGYGNVLLSGVADRTGHALNTLIG